jgi:hypothetical protein
MDIDLKRLRKERFAQSDDIEQFQQDFLQNKSSAPAARVVRAPKPAVRTNLAAAGSTKKVSFAHDEGQSSGAPPAAVESAETSAEQSSVPPAMKLECFKVKCK